MFSTDVQTFLHKQTRLDHDIVMFLEWWSSRVCMPVRCYIPIVVVVCSLIYFVECFVSSPLLYVDPSSTHTDITFLSTLNKYRFWNSVLFCAHSLTHSVAQCAKHKRPKIKTTRTTTTTKTSCLLSTKGERKHHLQWVRLYFNMLAH